MVNIEVEDTSRGVEQSGGCPLANVLAKHRNKREYYISQIIQETKVQREEQPHKVIYARVH